MSVHTGTAAEPLTRTSMRRALSALGLRPGDAVLIHCALSRLGWVCGGSLVVVQALLDVIGPTGTLVAPAFTTSNRDPSTWSPGVPAAWWPAIRTELPAFDAATSPSVAMGTVAECVRTWPGAVRSSHPQVSYAAVGPDAEWLMADHPLECHHGERSPLARLEKAEAVVLLLGVGWESCTAFHLAEYRCPSPPTRNYSCVVDRDGSWVTYRDVVLDDRLFSELGQALEQAGGVSAVPIGAGQARLVGLSPAVDFATGWLIDRRAA